MSLATVGAKAYLTSRGAGKIAYSKGGSLLEHLSRTEELLKSWEAPEHIQLAGLFHSAFGTSLQQKLLGPEDMDRVKILIGEEAFRLVTLFSRADPLSLSSQLGYWSVQDQATGEITKVSKDEAVGLVHLLLANATDRLTNVQYDDVMIEINHYVPFVELLTPKAAAFIKTLDRGTHSSEVFAPGLRFIGHAGVWLKEEAGSLVVDPWLYSSTFQDPILRGLQPYQRTLDFLIPRPVYTAKDLAPDIILFSHFHTHHAPIASLEKFARMKPVRVICPALSETDHVWIKNNIGAEAYDNITFEASDDDREHTFDDLTVRTFKHTQPHHLGFDVTTPTRHFVHITDASINPNREVTSVDPLWEKIRDIHPDMLFISAANHLARWGEGAERTIWEHSSLSPTQAAKLAVLLGTKRVGLIGMDNFSIWDSSLEYTHTAEAIENEFQWALEYLAPATEYIQLRPGKYIL
jgi:L-ascorbate metabolism protein UlaG (beta-lactamase superfamily)